MTARETINNFNLLTTEEQETIALDFYLNRKTCSFMDWLAMENATAPDRSLEAAYTSRYSTTS